MLYYAVLLAGCSKKEVLPTDRSFPSNPPFEIVEITERMNSAPEGIAQRSVFLYDQDRLVAYEFWHNSGGLLGSPANDWRQTIQVDYQYENGRMLGYTLQVILDGQRFTTRTLEYVYRYNDAYPDRAISTVTDINTLETNVFTFDYSYNDKGLIQSISTSDRRDEFFYNDSGGLIQSRSFDNRGLYLTTDFKPTDIVNPFHGTPPRLGVVRMHSSDYTSTFMVEHSTNIPSGQNPTNRTTIEFEKDQFNRPVRQITRFENLKQDGSVDTSDVIISDYKYK